MSALKSADFPEFGRPTSPRRSIAVRVTGPPAVAANLAPLCPRRRTSARSRPAATRPITASGPTPAVKPPPAPSARVEEVVEVLHGVEVSDPYRWMEDGESAETVEWVAAQNARTREVLDAIPLRATLHERALTLLRQPVSGGPAVAGEHLFHLKREGDQDQFVLVVNSAVDRNAPARVVVDPHAAAADHAASIDWFSPSPDGRLVAYGIADSGSERATLRILEVDTGAVLADAAPHVRHPSVSWLPDGSGFAYSRLPDPGSVEPGEDGYWETVWWHSVGTDVATDEAVMADELSRTALPATSISPDGRWLVVHIHLMPSRTDVVLIDRDSGARTVLVEGEEASTSVQVVGDRLYAFTNLGARRGRIVSAPLTSPRAGDWETLVPESSAVIEGFALAGDSLLVASTEHAVARLHRYRLDGSEGEEVTLPGIGSIGALDADPAHERAFLTFSSFERPSAIWRWTPDGLQEWDGRAKDGVEALVTEQVFYTSTDGVQVPMFLVRAPSTDPSPSTPTVLNGYGGFAIISSPGFSPGVVAWCEAGGVYAVAGIRGGGEYGEEWHRAGMLDHKGQVFDDFCAAADWLVAEGRTSRGHLAIRGGSNGGLLVGAAITRRPDLCRAAVCAVPLIDMLRYHRFLIGALWIPEYGDPDDPDHFTALLSYSPYHHVIDGIAYPSVLVTTAEADARVDPMHALKFAARLQVATAAPDDKPILLRLESRAGHGGGKPAWKQADEIADTWAFLAWQLGMDLLD
ncbi:MAG TPA: prolyl oligopeptidase family serine peptidase [Acidimicrobiales bacterium]|nr:prolyl oligopeptidase family serine peptidase [Acidimicrobiales bacterium]